MRPTFQSAIVGIFFLSLSVVQYTPTEVFAQNSTETANAEDAELNEFRTWLVDAWNKQDIDQILARVHPDIVVTWQDATVSRGHDQVRKYIEAKTKGPQSIVERVSAQPSVDGRKEFDNHIFSWGHMNDVFVLRKDGKELPFDSRFSAVLVRDNGSLVLAGIHFSANVFENPVMDLAMKQVRNLSGLIGSVIGLLIGLLYCRMRR